jgi:hypothetical protein
MQHGSTGRCSEEKRGTLLHEQLSAERRIHKEFPLQFAGFSVHENSGSCPKAKENFRGQTHQNGNEGGNGRAAAIPSAFSGRNASHTSRSFQTGR